jgi:large subunit ribosomal protein L17
MRHRVRSRKLGRSNSHRKAMYRNMVTSLLEHERIETTDAKAKEVRRIAEKMITLGKRGGIHARRQALRVIRSRDVAAKVFDELADRFREREGGYTRVLKIGIRRGDAAALSLVQLLEPDAPAAGDKTDSKKGAKKKAAKKKAKAAKDEDEGSKKKATKKKAAKKKTESKKTSAKKSSAKKPAAKKKTSKKKSGA